jgi:hypothetical protein
MSNVHRVIEFWAGQLPLEVWGLERDLKYLQCKEPWDCQATYHRYTEFDQPEGLVLYMPRFGARCQLLYRCEQHSDCRDCIELGQACHSQAESIRAWMASRSGNVSARLEDIEAFGLRSTSRPLYQSSAVVPGAIWSNKVGYVL